MFSVVSFLLMCLAISTAQQQRPNYTHHAVLDPDGKFQVHWLPGASDNDYFTIECEVATQGWLGWFAFSKFPHKWIQRNAVIYIQSHIFFLSTHLIFDIVRKKIFLSFLSLQGTTKFCSEKIIENI